MDMEDPSIFTKRIKIYDDLDADSDNVVLINESSNMQLGNGSRIWECGIILSKYFIKQDLEGSQKIKGKKILELGGGTGYLSIVLAALGGEVLCTDLKEILPLMKENIDNNSELFKEKKGSVKIQQLDWGNDKEKMRGIVEGMEFDYVVAADVIFNETHLATLSNCLKNLFEIWKEKNIQKRLPIAYVCYKLRNEEIDDEILANLEKIGFEGNQVPEDEMDKEYLNKRVDIFSLIFRGE